MTSVINHGRARRPAEPSAVPFARVLALCLIGMAAGPAGGEEIVAFSAAASSPDAWEADGVRVEATNRTLRFTREVGGSGRAVVRPHVANLPREGVRLFAQGEALLQVEGGSFAAQLAPAGWDTPAELALPSGPANWRMVLQLTGAAGSTLELRELLVSGSLDMDPPLLLLSGRTASQWEAQGDAEFRTDGLLIKGEVAAHERFAPATNAVAVLRLASVEGRGVRLAGIAEGTDGQQLGEIPLGAAGAAGLHCFDLGARAWPSGTAFVVLRLGPAEAGASGLLADLWVGRAP